MVKPALLARRDLHRAQNRPAAVVPPLKVSESFLHLTASPSSLGTASRRRLFLETPHFPTRVDLQDADANSPGIQLGVSQGLAGQEAKTEPDQDVFTKNLGSKLPTQTLSFASPWRPLQARMAKQDRPLSARPILPAQWSTNWQLSRPIPSLKAHMPVSTREDLTLPHDATTTTKSIRDLTARFDELQAGKRPLDSDEAYFQISTGSNTEYDLPRAWISNVETHARKAEPSGPKNLTSFFISQKARESKKRVARLLDTTKALEQAKPDSRPGQRQDSPFEFVRPWQKHLQHFPFALRLSSEQQASMHGEVEVREFAHGEYIFQEGQSFGHKVWLVIEGAVGLYASSSKTLLHRVSTLNTDPYLAGLNEDDQEHLVLGLCESRCASGVDIGYNVSVVAEAASTVCLGIPRHFVDLSLSPQLPTFALQAPTSADGTFVPYNLSQQSQNVANEQKAPQKNSSACAVEANSVDARTAVSRDTENNHACYDAVRRLVIADGLLRMRSPAVGDTGKVGDKKTVRSAFKSMQLGARVCWRAHPSSMYTLASEDMQAVISFLQQLSLFDCNQGGVERAVKEGRFVMRYVFEGDHILRQGARDSSTLFILYKGQAEAESYSARIGAMMTSAVIAQGQLLEVAAVVRQQDNCTSVVARSDCKLIGVPHSLMEEMGILHSILKSSICELDGNERGKSNFEARVERFFHAFDKDADGILSQDELYHLLRSLGFSYSEEQVAIALRKFSSESPHDDGRIDLPFFRNFWKTCNFLDPLTVDDMSQQEDYVPSNPNAVECRSPDSFKGLYNQIARASKLDPGEEIVQVMQQKASEARSIWQQFGSGRLVLEKVDVRMLLIDVGCLDCSVAAVERLFLTEWKNEDGRVHLEDFVQWWMLYHMRLQQVKIDERMRTLQRQSTLLKRQQTAGAGSLCSSPEREDTHYTPHLDHIPHQTPVETPHLKPSTPSTPGVPGGLTLDASVGTELPTESTPAAQEDTNKAGVPSMDVSRHHPSVELAEDEALDVLEQLMGDKQQSRRHVQIPAFRAVSFVKAMMERTDLAKKLGCADDRGEADRDKIVTAYDCMRPHKQACADTECFLNYFGPRGRLSTSHQKTSLGGLLNILK